MGKTVGFAISCWQRASDFISDLDTRFCPVFFLLSRLRFKRWSDKDIRKYQQSRLRRMVRWAVRKTRFYRTHFRGFELTDFQSLPITSKRLMMQNLSDFNSVGLSKEEILDFCLRAENSRDFSHRLKGINVGMSSGTSGNKGVEMATRGEEKFLRAYFLARFDFPRAEKINLAFILRVTSPAFNLNLLGHRLTYIDQLDSIRNICDKLSRLQPNIISGPPSMLRLIGRQAESGHLNLQLKRIVTYAEVLYPDVRAYLSRVFQCPVHEIYKCSEGALAITCSHQKLHVNEDLVYLELLRTDGTPTPDGEPCHQLLITDLHKRSLPILRYALNDIITISESKCLCGSNFRVIESIQGRSDDMFWGVRAPGEEPQFIFPDFITRKIISVSDDIAEFQAIQKDYTFVDVRAELAEGADPEFIRQKIVEGIREVFTRYECIPPEVGVSFETSLHNNSQAKFRRTICHIHHEST